MRTLEEARDRFAYHPATPGPGGTAVRHAALRDLLDEVLVRAWELIPDGPDKTRAFHALHEFGTIGNLAIAPAATADTSASLSVARVLSEEIVVVDADAGEDLRYSSSDDEPVF